MKKTKDSIFNQEVTEDERLGFQKWKKAEVNKLPFSTHTTIVQFYKLISRSWLNKNTAKSSRRYKKNKLLTFSRGLPEHNFSGLK